MPNRTEDTQVGSARTSPNPTGRRPRGPDHFASERAAMAFDGLPEGDNHLELEDLLRTVGRHAGWPTALVDHFVKLLHWTRPVDWTAGAQPIVWLSVAETAEELGISPSQVRRNEASLHRLGAISWKDSPNHRRYGKRNQDGEIQEAWGVNLAPAAALVPELRQLLERRSQNRATHRHLRHAVAGARGRLAAAIETALANAQLDPTAAEAWRRQVAEAAPSTLHGIPLQNLEHSLNRLGYLDAVLQQDLAAQTEASDPPAHDNQNPGKPVEMRADPKDDAAQGTHPCLPPLDYTTTDLSLRDAVDQGSTRQGGGVGESEPLDPPPEPAARPVRIPVNAFWEILPDRIRDWLHEPGPNWPDIVEAARRAAGGLDISGDAWVDACQALGRREAAAAVAIIAIKHDAGLIHTPGGYLRGMTERGRAGELDLAATIFGLRDRKRRSARAGAPPRGEAE